MIGFLTVFDKILAQFFFFLNKSFERKWMEKLLPTVFEFTILYMRKYRHDYVNQNVLVFFL